MTDEIAIHAISTRARIGPSEWDYSTVSNQPQPVLVSLWTPYNLQLAGNTDDLDHSLNYAAVCDTIERCFHATQVFSGPLEAAESVAAACFAAHPTLTQVRLRVELPRAALRAKSTAVEIERHRTAHVSPSVPDAFIVTDLLLDPIVGVNSCERLFQQQIILNLRLEPGSAAGDVFSVFDTVRKVSDSVFAYSYLTLEALGANIVDAALESCDKVSVSIAKPSALMFATAPAITITRERHLLSDGLGLSIPAAQVVTVAFGSNLGDRFRNIDDALTRLEAANVKIVGTSFLYETKPMYVEEQAQFLNGACLVETNQGPMEFMYLLKEIERDVGRVASFRNGPRAIDLDIVFWGVDALNIDAQEALADGEIGVQNLIVPHQRAHEREFVLRPLNDIIPDFVHPKLHRTVNQLLREVSPDDSSLTQRTIEFPTGNASSVQWKWGKRTFLMATLNVTPDSFSDGGDHSSLDAAVGYARRAVEDGADIIDIGGCSTRPGAVDVSEEEEIARVVPAVQALRSAGISLPISVDTFRAAVAEKAIAAGASCINDVTAFARDPRMASVAARLRVPVVLMHSRGSADQNKEYSNVMRDVRQELGNATKLALAAGVRRWNIIADPGVGFSKTVDGNLVSIRDLGQLTAREASSPYAFTRGLQKLPHPLDGLPTLVGTSRKSFLGKLTGKDMQPKERDFATAAAVTASIQQGCDIVRVHNVAALRDVVLVADALWRRRL